MKRLLYILLLTMPAASAAMQSPVEIHERLSAGAGTAKQVALTLDACSGGFDRLLIEYLIRNRIPATLFVTKKWLDRNPEGLSVIRAHLDLFDVENHGERHIAAVLGAGRRVHGIPGARDLAHLQREVLLGARAVQQATGIAPRWYRDATANYDPQAIGEIKKLGYRIAGFSVNADSGATLSKAAIEQRLRRVQAGDVIIGHMNKPASASAAGLSAGLARLQEAGFVFVRLDQVELTPAPERAAKPRRAAARGSAAS